MDKVRGAELVKIILAACGVYLSKGLFYRLPAAHSYNYLQNL